MVAALYLPAQTSYSVGRLARLPRSPLPRCRASGQNHDAAAVISGGADRGRCAIYANSLARICAAFLWQSSSCRFLAILSGPCSELGFRHQQPGHAAGGGQGPDKCLLREPCKLRPVSGGASHPCGERVITPTRLKPGNLAALVLGGGRDARVAVDDANSRPSQEPNSSSSTLQRTLGNRFGADCQPGSWELLGWWQRQVVRQPASSLEVSWLAAPGSHQTNQVASSTTTVVATPAQVCSLSTAACISAPKMPSIGPV
jgi:hypothetical protein